MNRMKSIALRTAGQRHGPIVRLISPHELGQRLKPFVFLDHLHADMPEGAGFGFHPHSGIATVTYQRDVDAAFVDTAGRQGVLRAQGLEWMLAGGGAWHKATLTRGGWVNGFQLWLALPPGWEDAQATSLCLAPEAVPEVGPVRVLAGEFGGRRSSIDSPVPFTYLDVALDEGVEWQHEVPAAHQVAWAYAYGGLAEINGAITQNELLVFSAQVSALRASARQPGVRLLFASAPAHPHPLVLGSSSVHTNTHSLLAARQRIHQLGQALQHEGKLES